MIQRLSINHNKAYQKWSDCLLAKAENQMVAIELVEGLVKLASSKNILDGVKSDLDNLNCMIKENPSLHDAMVNPMVSTESKLKFIGEVSTEATFNEPTTRFLNLVIEKGRIDCILEIIEEFEAEYCKATETKVAVITSASALEKELEANIARSIQRRTQSKSVRVVFY